MIFQSAVKAFENKGILDIQKIEGGYLAKISDSSRYDRGLPVLLDENFNKIGEISGIVFFADNIRLIGKKEGYNYFVDYNGEDYEEGDKIETEKTNFLYRISKPIVITNEDKERKEIALSKDIVFDENNKVIVNSQSYDIDVDAFLENIEPTAGETYDLGELHRRKLVIFYYSSCNC